jgi:hypothetical protein
MENLMTKTKLIKALNNDIRAKAWIAPNLALFTNSEKNDDMFLTTYRIRNSYEYLLNKLEIDQEISEHKDMVLVQRLFDMDFYPPRKMSLSDWKNGRDPRVAIKKAYKDRRWKGNRRRKFEITLELDNGDIYQINPNDVMNKFLNITSSLPSLLQSNL